MTRETWLWMQASVSLFAAAAAAMQRAARETDLDDERLEAPESDAAPS